MSESNTNDDPSPDPTLPPPDPLPGPNDPHDDEPNPPEQPLEERLKDFENRLKLLTGVVSIVALAAPIASAAAAVGSLLTARDSLKIAEIVQKTSGANLSVDHTIQFVGSCESQALTMRVRFHNDGHLAGRVTGVDIAVEAIDAKGTWGGYDPGYPLNGKPYKTIATTSTPLTVTAQDGADAIMQVDCATFQANRPNPTAPVTQADLVSQRQEIASRLKIVYSSSIDATTTIAPVADIQWAGYTFDNH